MPKRMISFPKEQPNIVVSKRIPNCQYCDNSSSAIIQSNHWDWLKPDIVIFSHNSVETSVFGDDSVPEAGTLFFSFSFQFSFYHFKFISLRIWNNLYSKILNVFLNLKKAVYQHQLSTDTLARFCFHSILQKICTLSILLDFFSILNAYLCVFKI